MTIIRTRSRIKLMLNAAIMLFGLLTLSSAQAFTFCVNNVPLLKAALSQAQFLTQQPINIQIVQGLYLMDSDVAFTFAPPTTIEGGYTPNCAARVIDPANTVINIGQNHEFSLQQLSASPQALLSIDGVTFSNSNQGMHLQAGAHGVSNDEGRLSIRNVRFTQMALPSSTPSLKLMAFNGSLFLENVLIDHIASGSSCTLRLYSEGHATIRINHLTADLVSGSDFCLDDSGQETQISFHNSIVWSSDGGQSIVRSYTNNFEQDPDTSVSFVNTLFRGHSIVGVPNVQNQINAAPGWINPAAGNYRLTSSPLSPAIDSGTLFVPGGEPATDIEGNSHFIGSAPDRGAYESAFSSQTVLFVSNTLDSGLGSLRQAITTANLSLSPPKQIKFDIRNAANVPTCPAVIALDTPLPPISGRMTIDGYTQPFSTKNTSTSAFNAKLCVILKPASGTLGTAFVVPDGSFGSLTLRGLGIGGFGQPVKILGGQSSVIAGNQFGGVANGVVLPGAGLNAITIGANATGDLIIGGVNAGDRNVIGGAAFSGIDNQANGASAFTTCQVINNLIGLTPSGDNALANSFGVNVSGSGCEIVGNRIAGNSIVNLWLNASSGNVVQRNHIGVTHLNTGFDDAATGVLATGSNNIIGAGGNGGSITGNTIRFNVAGGVIIRGTGVSGNSVRANSIHNNGFDGFSGQRMDIDLQATSATTGPSQNDAGDADVGPNKLQNFPTPTALNYTGAGNVNRPATVSGVLDAQPGTYRIDAYFSNSANVNGNRGFAEFFLGVTTLVVGNGPASFSMPVLVPNQLPGGVISFTATDAGGNTSEVGTSLSIITPLLFGGGFESSN